MWFTTKEATTGNLVKIVWIKEQDPHFEVYGSDEKFKQFIGSIVWAEKSSYEYEGKDRDVFILHLVDEQWDKYKLSSSYTQLSRWMLNTLLSMNDYQNINISLYVKPSVGKDWKEYINCRASVWKNGELQKRKYMPADLPKPEKITNSKWEFVSNDYGDVDAFWMSKIEEIDKIAKNVATSIKASSDDDLPF